MAREVPTSALPKSADGEGTALAQCSPDLSDKQNHLGAC